MDEFESIAEQVVVHKIRATWLEMSRMFNTIASVYDTSFAVGLTLIAIYEADGTPVTKIGPRMGVEPNSLSRVLKSLENDKYITRVKDPYDKRKVLVKLTDKGSKLREICLNTVYRVNDAMLEDLDPIKVKHFYEVFDSFSNSMKKTANEIIAENNMK